MQLYFASSPCFPGHGFHLGSWEKKRHDIYIWAYKRQDSDKSLDSGCRLSFRILTTLDFSPVTEGKLLSVPQLPHLKMRIILPTSWILVKIQCDSMKIQAPGT